MSPRITESERIRLSDNPRAELRDGVLFIGDNPDTDCRRCCLVYDATEFRMCPRCRLAGTVFIAERRGPPVVH